jgi:GH35 family endo-1,4-beta-xylanase
LLGEFSQDTLPLLPDRDCFKVATNHPSDSSLPDLNSEESMNCFSCLKSMLLLVGLVSFALALDPGPKLSGALEMKGERAVAIVNASRQGSANDRPAVHLTGVWQSTPRLNFVQLAQVKNEPSQRQEVQEKPVTDRRSLKEAVGDRFKVGVGVGHQVLKQPEDAVLIRQHFQILTPENCMKPQSIHPREDQWNFEASDQFAEFARNNKLEVVGHCLVWAKDDRTDEWMKRENGEPVSRATLLRRIESHIETVVGRYGDIVTMWDVVNEALADTGDHLLRDSVYSRATGIDFIVTAFKTARAKDPEAMLIYNDYNDHKPEKREKLIRLLTELKEKGAPVDAYGMQGHFELGENEIPQLRKTFDELRRLKIKVVVSELDIDVVTRGRWWADNGRLREELAKYDPYKDGLPNKIQEKQIEQYVQLFKLFDEYRDIIVRVSFWNLHDGQSWLNYFPWNRVNYPLLFDRDRKPKPAFDAVYETLRTSRSAAAH